MSQVLSEDFEEVVVDKKKRLLGIKCDCCEKVIRPKTRNYSKDEIRYFRVTTGHHDWGNDSCESVESKDICPECISKFISDYCKEAEGTEWLELKTEYVYDELVSVNRWRW